MKNHIKNNVKEILNFTKKFKKGSESILSVIFIMFLPLLDSKKTKKKTRVGNLSYQVLKDLPTNFAVKLIRIFAIKEFKINYEEWLKKSNSQKSKKKFKIRIDGTKTGKKYANNMPALKLLYDYVNRCHIKTHTIYLMVVSIGNKDYIVDFKLIKKDKYSLNKIAKSMLNTFLREIGKNKTTLKYARLSLDGAWGNGDMLHYIYKKGFRYNSIKSGGKDKVIYKGQEFNLKGLEKHLSKVSSFKCFNSCHNLDGDYCSVIAKLKGKDIKIRLVLRRFKNNPNKCKRKYRFLMLISTNIDNQDVNDYQIVQCYDGRWGIEECIKINKQVTKLEEYSFHSNTTGNIEVFFCLRFCLYMVLNWYRVEHCRYSLTSIYKVADMFKYYFRDIGYRQVWKLFSL